MHIPQLLFPLKSIYSTVHIFFFYTFCSKVLLCRYWHVVGILLLMFILKGVCLMIMLSIEKRKHH